MAITSYSELQTAIAGYTHRDDVAAKATEFISLAESRLKVALARKPVLGLEKTATLSTTGGTATLPTDWIASREAYLNTDPKTHLEIVPLGYMNSVWGGSETGKPEMMSISDGKIILAPAPDASYDLELTYYGFTPLSASNTTNWLLTNHPKLYLSACLAEAFTWSQNDREAQKHEQITAGLIEQIQDTDAVAMWSQSPLEIRPS